MQYFKHSELTDKYRVSLKTVHNWIDAAKQGKASLKLYTAKNRTYIANTSENELLLKKLSERGKKYRNSLHHRVVEPKSDFYSIYNRRQILDIITNLSVHREIPRQYNYLENGATNWDNWTKRLAEEDSPNILKGTLELLRANMAAIDKLIEGGKRINIIDLGVGNAYPVKELLGHLIEMGLLHRYIAIDISPSMISLAERNIKEWYGDKVNFEGYVKDISYERFDDVLLDDMLGDEANETINLALLLGGTPINFRTFSDVLKPISGSMGANDLLVYTVKPDTEAARSYFDFNTSNLNKLSPSHQYILELLNVEESLYNVEMGFDAVQKMRYVRVRLKSAFTIKFDFGETERSVSFEKGDTILLLRVRHMTVLETISEFEKEGFALLQSSLTRDRQFFLSISGVEVKSSAND